jgi:hypothetical protein
LATSSSRAETIPYSAKFEIQLAGLKSLIAEKDRHVTDLEPTARSFARTATGSPENRQDERVYEGQAARISILAGGNPRDRKR